MRAKGYTIMKFAMYITLLFNQYVHPIALDNMHWRYYIFYCSFLAVEVVVIYFLYVETRYMPLDEITKIFDGEHIGTPTNLEMTRIGENGKGMSTVIHIEDTGVRVGSAVQSIERVLACELTEVE